MYNEENSEDKLLRQSSKNELSLLFKVSITLNRGHELRSSLQEILRHISEYLELQSCVITLYNPANGDIFIEEAYGLTEEEIAKGKYKADEGITGKVISTEEPMIIPRVSEESLYLDRTGAKSSRRFNEMSFICVPLVFNGETLGTLSILRTYEAMRNLHDDQSLLVVVNSILAPAIKSIQEELVEKEKLQHENFRLSPAAKKENNPDNMIGVSGQMEEVYKLIRQVAETNATVLITGESGVGKELVANAIHATSARKKMPYIKINCSALPDNLIESELFGYEKGAFTGASGMKKGRFELADGGTLFLDEVGDLPASTQVKILRFLQEKEFERLGGNRTIKVDVRLITATNRDLEDSIRSGDFREDLYYRLNVFPIYVPPLRERKSDLTLLADYFIGQFNLNNIKKIKRISTSAIDMIMSYHWPGNIRELQNCIERAAILSSNGVIYGFHLPPTLQFPNDSEEKPKGTLKSALEHLEKEMVYEALKLTDGNIVKAAQRLGITERIMGLRIKKYNVNPNRFKTSD